MDPENEQSVEVLAARIAELEAEIEELKSGSADPEAAAEAAAAIADEVAEAAADVEPGVPVAPAAEGAPAVPGAGMSAVERKTFLALSAKVKKLTDERDQAAAEKYVDGLGLSMDDEQRTHMLELHKRGDHKMVAAFSRSLPKAPTPRTRQALRGASGALTPEKAREAAWAAVNAGKAPNFAEALKGVYAGAAL